MASNIIDSICSSNCFIFAYPGYLSIGEAKYQDLSIACNEEKEIRIPAIILTEVIRNLLLVGKELEKSNLSKNFKLNILETQTSFVKAKPNTDSEDEISLILRTNTKIIYVINFNLHDYLLLLKGIKCLFFKPFGISFENEFFLNSMIDILKNDPNSNPLKNVKTWSDSFLFLKSLFPNENKVKLLFSSQLVERYLRELNLYLKLTKKVDVAINVLMECE